jgi:hypothetical protein
MAHNFRPHPPTVSEALARMDLEKHNASIRNPGYRVTQWKEDEYNNPTVRVEWFMGANPDVGLGRKYEGRVAQARRDKHREIMEELQELGYHVVWGWDPETGEPDTNFIVVISPESARYDAKAAGLPVGELEDEPEDAEDAEDRLARLEGSVVITLEQAQEAAKEIERYYRTGRDADARRLEHSLMKAVCTAIVCGTQDGVDLAAAALSTQHLFFAR